MFSIIKYKSFVSETDNPEWKQQYLWLADLISIVFYISI